ncbi:MAG TPA: P-loop NTPase [Hyphomicrobiaceae bacterium]|nr:P-loop NTPase [Hyphomicrobiaceae bacterium]
MTVNKDQVLEALRKVKGPNLEGNIVDLGLVSEILLKDGRAYFSITVPAERAEELEPLRQAAEKVVSAVPGITGVAAVLTADAAPSRTRAPENPRVQAARAAAVGQSRPPHAHTHDHGHGHAPRPAASSAGPTAAKIPGIRHLIAVASGKGGVGKSTTTVNLALGFQAMGLRVGILDADIYGPSQPRLLGLTGRPQAQADKKLKPMEAYGLQAMSMGFLVDEGTPIIWRGPMVVSALTQMLREVAWGAPGADLDVLVIDMPPGTGDVQLTMAQQVPLSGAVIVSTPQDLALIDARKGLNMFKKVDVPVLGIIENMSYFVCSKCGERHEIFGHGGAEAEAKSLDITFLGAVPLHIDIRSRSDAGQPIVASSPSGIHAQIYRDIAAKTWNELEISQGKRHAPPRLDVVEGGAMLEVAFDGRPPFRLPAEMLRVMSPSAEVQGHAPDQRVTVARKRNVKIRELQPVGNYAVKIVFDDGHNTGLYAWNYLDTLHTERDARWAEYLSELKAKGLDRG